MCSSALMRTVNFTSTRHQVVVVIMTLSHNAKRDQHTRGRRRKGVKKSPARACVLAGRALMRRKDKTTQGKYANCSGTNRMFWNKEKRSSHESTMRVSGLPEMQVFLARRRKPEGILSNTGPKSSPQRAEPSQESDPGPARCWAAQLAAPANK